MEVRDSSRMTYYDFKFNQAQKLYKEAVIDEDEHQAIIDGLKLQQCHAICLTLTEEHAKTPLDIQAQANYYLSVGRSDTVALRYLRKAVLSCDLFKARTGTPVQGRELFETALHAMQAAAGAEQSEYGGAAAASSRGPAANGRNGGPLEACGLPTTAFTTPSPTSRPSRKLPTLRGSHAKRESLSNEDRDIE